MPGRRAPRGRFWRLALIVMIGAVIAAASVPLDPQPARARQAAPVTPRVRVWWPDDLYPAEDSDAEAILLRQWDSFRATYRRYELDVRRKRASGLGGILPTLRSASAVAPAALPDLALMRRVDMITAADEGLLVPLSDWVPADMLDTNLLPGVQALGEIDGELYGVPYLLTLWHALYRASAFSAPPARFADILRESPDYLFPGGSAANTVVNTTLLLQYTQAGGRLIGEAGEPVLDRAPLLSVLNYYAAGAAQEIFPPEMLEITQPATYWSTFVSGEASLIQVDSSYYLRHQAEVENTALASTPTRDGEAITALNGWMWVLITQDTDRQDRARAFLSWMMRVSQQAALSEALGMIPSQARALDQWQDRTYADFAAALIPHGLIVAGAQRSSSASALQESFADVLKGAAPEQAAADAIASLGR